MLDQPGVLAMAGSDSAGLRQTLRHYLLANLRLGIRAQTLHIHCNTLVYRLRRIAALLGRPVTEAVTETQCALLVAKQPGNSVLAETAADTPDDAAKRTKQRSIIGDIAR